MKTADAIWMCLPEGMDELFEMVRFERTEQSYNIWLDEKKKRVSPKPAGVYISNLYRVFICCRHFRNLAILLRAAEDFFEKMYCIF